MRSGPRARPRRLRRALLGVDVDPCSPNEQLVVERARCGEGLIEHPSRDLNAQFGRGFGRSNLFQLHAFYLAYRPLEIPSVRPQASKVQTTSGLCLASMATIDPSEMLSLVNGTTWSPFLQMGRLPTVVPVDATATGTP